MRTTSFKEKCCLRVGGNLNTISLKISQTIYSLGSNKLICYFCSHRKLKRLVVIELKLDEFKPEHKGQVELYLKWLDKYEKAEGEESPVAIILCATKSDTMTELLELNNSGIHVARYLTNYVPKELLEEKFLSSIKNAKIQLEQRKRKEEKD